MQYAWLLLFEAHFVGSLEAVPGDNSTCALRQEHNSPNCKWVLMYPALGVVMFPQSL